MDKRDFLYEGKAKRIYRTDEPETLLVEYKDDLTAFNARKKATMEGKGALNNKISAYLLEYLEQQSIPTHFLRQLGTLQQLVRKVTILPIEVVVRNIATGSLCRRLGVEDGLQLQCPLVELFLKDDDLDDPLINDDHALLFGWATEPQLAEMKRLATEINGILTGLFAPKGIVLVDFKLEFGTTADGTILLADEISPDTCRFWDSETMDKLDKDRFRNDLDDVLGAYREIWRRLTGEETR